MTDSGVPTQMEETGLGLEESQWMGNKDGKGPQVQRCFGGSRAGGFESCKAPSLPQRALQGSHSGVQGSPQCGPLLLVIAANDLACRGLDHLEEKIPALQYPHEKVSPFLLLTLPYTLLSLPPLPPTSGEERAGAADAMIESISFPWQMSLKTGGGCLPPRSQDGLLPPPVEPNEGRVSGTSRQNPETNLNRSVG